jgi:hypothetical protein
LIGGERLLALLYQSLQQGFCYLRYLGLCEGREVDSGSLAKDSEQLLFEHFRSKAFVASGLVINQRLVEGNGGSPRIQKDRDEAAGFDALTLGARAG